MSVLMRYTFNDSERTVSVQGNVVDDGGHNDDIIERADSVLSSDAAVDIVSRQKRRYKIFLKVLQKLIMCFLVIFIGYFAWTISANFSYSGTRDSNRNLTDLYNTSMQIDNSSSNSGSRYIPFHSSSDDNHTDPPYQPNIIMPSHRKQTKKRRKKGRHRKRKNRRNRKTTYSSLEDFLNLTVEHRKNRNAKNVCSDCKIRKRKGRREKDTGRIKPSVLRKILEKVADETLSGARTGEGTITSLFKNDVVPEGTRLGPDDTGWSYDQHWVSIGEDSISSKDTVYGSRDDFRGKTQWSPWSSCSTSCGAGQQERMRKCGTACTEVESMVCVNPQCEGTSDEDSSSTISEFYKWEQKGFVPPVNLPEQQFLEPDKDVCGKWMRCNHKFAQEFISNSSLPACPCLFPLIRVRSKDVYDTKTDRNVRWLDASSHNDLVYKPGAYVCMRSALYKGTTTLAVQQCCYDRSYSLISRGQAAGTPILISPEISKELHHKIDLLPWIICKGDWIRYNKVFPPNNDLKCHKNPDDEILKWQKEQITNY